MADVSIFAMTNNSVTNSEFQHVYEFLNFEDVKATNNIHTSSNSLAHNHRKIAAQLYFATNSGKIDDPAVAKTLLDHHLLQYYKIVDQQESKGLDNYSKGALALCNSAKNESKNWSLKDLTINGTFQELESSLKAKQTSSVTNVLELEKTIDFVVKLETTKTTAVEETCTKSAIPSVVTKLKPSPFEPSVPEFKPIPRPQPVNKHWHPTSVSVPLHKPTEDTVNQSSGYNAFRTAREQLIVDQKKKNQSGNQSGQNAPSNGPGLGISRQKTLGTRRALNSPFILPIKNNNHDENSYRESNTDIQDSENKIADERLKNIDPKMVELIENEIMDNGKPVNWDDIAGLEFAKTTIKEIVVWPMLRPDIFTGLRGPPRGILLFGPPGTGKTLIGKCIASQSKSTFFSISASSLTSKWVGEGEKMVRALFAVARVNQPSVIFIDEIDSLLSQRSDTEHESSRRIKTEFLVQLDGATTSSEDRLLVVGATNRPQELDEAARRRLVKRLYIPLPEFAARKQIIQLLMAPQRHDLGESAIDDICHRTDGYSCADMTNLCKEAAYGPIRSIPLEDIEHITPEEVRPIINQDFEAALGQVRASVSSQDLALYEDWNNLFGSGAK